MIMKKMNPLNQPSDHLLASTTVKMNSVNASTQDFRTMSLEQLIDHIKVHHHTFIREQTSIIQHLAEMVNQRFGKDYEYLSELYEITCSLLDNLMPHLLKEERIIFPYIEYMESMAEKGKLPKKPPFGDVRGPVLRMHNDHDQASSMLARLRELSNNFEAPANADDDWRALYDKLRHLESDMHTHLHLEDDILFRRAVALESQLGMV